MSVYRIDVVASFNVEADNEFEAEEEALEIIKDNYLHVSNLEDLKEAQGG